ncbi:hypothetical protein ADN00_03365 [Ornatilinea apprima]|uniref:Uncharacterized protein n=1 Tax=Ornatilinea apprima TaxID=1134406 RepID=A0A0P6Y1L7_9CHLR|nr:hypothetical protein [Ornatilinea apprima]KPL78950.1 hypothetical protein ADN00_03365 [Ornatilinea apprima]
MNINIIKNQTNAVVTEIYGKLRQGSFTKDRIKELEETLSTKIYESEKMITQCKKNNHQAAQEEFYRRRTLLKRLADGLAWILLDYDFHKIFGCSIGHSAGFMYGKEGYLTERRFINDAFNNPNVVSAIQCDITNILHLADILVFTRDKGIQPIEIKGCTSKHDRRSIRQRNRHNEIVQLINMGKSEAVLVKNTPFRSVETNMVYTHYWDVLENLSIDALKCGFSWQLLDKCVYLAVCNSRSRISSEDFLSSISDADWENGSIIISSLSRHLNKNLNNIPPYCLPITVFPITPDIGIEFLLGNLDAVIAINLEKFAEQFNKNGSYVLLKPHNELEVRIDRDQFTILEGAWSRILNELVTIPSFINQIFTVYQKSKII